MQVFAVLKVANPDLVRSTVEKRYNANHYDAGDGVFFIAAKGETTRQLATKIGLGDETGEGTTSGIVLPVTAFWGRYDPDPWEWIGAKQNANGE